MTPDDIRQLLENYTALVRRVDDHIQRVEVQYKDNIVCRKGCDSCCRFLTLFPVEAFTVSIAFSRLPEILKEKIVQKAEASSDRCPLLIDNACTIYPSRPIICRTHGFPILVERDGEPAVDFCPENFKGIATFPGQMLLSVEQLNQTLFAVNGHFVESIDPDRELPERIPVSDALLWVEDTED